jgi:hypothetical protein
MLANKMTPGSADRQASVLLVLNDYLRPPGCERKQTSKTQKCRAE